MKTRPPVPSTSPSPFAGARPDRAFGARRGFLAIPFQDRMDLPSEVVEAFFSLPSPGEIEVVMPGQTARRGGGDYLYLWKADKFHRHDTWFVRMRPARGGIKQRWSTSCRIDELDRAKAKYLACLSGLRNQHLNRLSPKARPVTDVLREFVSHTSERHHSLGKVSAGWLYGVVASVERLLPRFTGKRVDELGASTSTEWMAWAKTLRPAGGGYAHNTALLDIQVLRMALEAILNTDETVYRAPFEMPAEAPTSNDVFTPFEIDRVLLAAETGRIWDAHKGDWLRDNEGECILRRTEVARAAAPYGRLFQLGIWFGSRLAVNLALTWTDMGGPWIDLDRMLLHRLGSAEQESLKRKGFCKIPPKAGPVLRAWRDEDLKRGCDRVIHTWDYGPIKEANYGVWYNLLEAAGAKNLNPHALKHTCVWILKLEGVSLTEAADYLFTWPHTLVKRYGPDWDVRGMSAAADALGSMRRFRIRYENEAALTAGRPDYPPKAANDDANVA